ncbi:unnamed protein product [Camellia sinensis]
MAAQNPFVFSGDRKLRPQLRLLRQAKIESIKRKIERQTGNQTILSQKMALQKSSSSSFLLPLCLLLVLQLLLWLTKTSAQSHARSGCQEYCGDVRIPYPFGIGPNCYLDEWFSIRCKRSSSNDIGFAPYLIKIDLEVLEISLNGNCLRVNNPVTSPNCHINNNSSNNLNLNPNNASSILSIDLRSSPFRFSEINNVFMATGMNCSNQGAISHNFSGVQTHVPSVLNWVVHNIAQLRLVPDNNKNSYSCLQGSLAYSSIPIGSDMHDSSLLDKCVVVQTLQCVCNFPFYGNPYFSNGCVDTSIKPPKPNARTIFSLFIVSWWVYKIMEKIMKKINDEQREINDKQRKENFFKRNGGFLLQHKLSSSDGSEKIILFNSKELEKATDHYHEDRILGQGGQGTVYKGMLSDGRIIAVKKSKVVAKGQVEQFINEVVILSQIVHRNIVKLLGCCLETEVPMLIYEFIPNGTLSQHIHDPNEEFPLSWEMRFRIAIEVAGALSYLHYAASIPIYHRDMKSTNILLDDKYKAKVSDFGTSTSIDVDNTHLTTRVQGTFGYFDPEYFRSNQFTDKSDVYSFGVVIVELLTGQKPIFSTRSEESKSLVTHFMESMEENCLLEILDPRILKEGRREEMIAVAHLARRCLNLNGKKRPTMKDVAVELEGIRMSQGSSTIHQHYKKLNTVQLI